MEGFPPECTDTFRSELYAVIKLCNGGSKKEKEIRTILSRRTHFLWYCSERNILPFIFLVTNKDKSLPILQMNFVMACYATFLATGHTLQSKSIKADTIQKYLTDAKTFIQKFDLIKRDATIDEATNKTAFCISKVITEQRRFEGVKNRREPYTLAIHRTLHQQTQLQAKHSKESACCDWFLLALLFGWRQIEFCQSAGSGILTRVHLNSFGDAYAFTLNDIRLYGSGKIELDFKTAMKIPTLMKYIKVQFRWQKNGDHGISRWCARNDKSPYLCPVRRWHNILS